MAHPKYNNKITKKDLQKKHYVSQVEEFRRHTRIHKVIKVSYSNKDNLFEDLIKVLRKLYNAPNKDFSKVQTKLMLDKYPYEIINYKMGEILELEAVLRGQLYNIKYKIKKYIWGGYVVHYYDYSLTQKTMWGLLANLAKYYYKKSVRKNSLLIKKELKKLKKERK